ncbi:TIGR01620 family protein [Rheinheimera baltica]|uniref:TIGR01620 family protein n=1 Tax=Rheinheimera baltica TaxID=67576 RepID=A0ABT9HTL8_9GAMM|nr:TIGR01620 family protein [Rheinheimera baltica]MDP5134480.1 TIGR01620 family protein [Rheinheimera baltica]MDP5148534.1 TIGR01620 family protein [Rheinheimera baltica]
MSELKQARHFEPQQLTPLPELKAASHFDNDAFVAADNAAPVALKQPIRWWWRLAGLTLVAIIVLSVWQWCQTLLLSWQQNVVYGIFLSLITAAVGVLCATVLWREVKLWRRLARNRRWQHNADRIRHSVQYGEAGELCKAVADSLPASPAITAAKQQWQNALTDAHSDEEQLQLFERFVLAELDKQAQQLIYRAATDTSLAVAISPFALADMLLVLWRSSRLVRELAQLYGGAIGQLRSMLLLKRLLGALLWAGGSELALDMASDVLGSELTSKLSARAGQGIIAGLLVARLGNLAQQQLRPLPASESAKVSIKSLSTSLLSRFKAAVQTKADNKG